jgi:N-glycosylase/DNA lyase
MLNPVEGVKTLAAEILELREDPEVRCQVEDRVTGFLDVNDRDTYAWFEELTYCLLTAYSSARMGQLCTDALCDRGALLQGSLQKVEEILVDQGHRFAKRRSKYIVRARALAPTLKPTIQGFDDPKEARVWLAENVKGLGWKESSHFLRNVGYLDLAIIDRHILSNMVECGLITERPPSLTKRRYMEYEGLLGAVADRVDMDLGEMDLYLWYRKTGKVLK